MPSMFVQLVSNNYIYIAESVPTVNNSVFNVRVSVYYVQEQRELIELNNTKLN